MIEHLGNDATGDLKASVREKYGQAAQRVAQAATDGACCGSSACCGATTDAWDPITANLYDDGEKAGVPAEALLASLGCGNPTALAELHEGETVLDLGSGGGIDVLLSARRVGPSGTVYGLDMTDEMLALANDNKRRAGVGNVQFLKGEIENIPLPSESVDVIISNCVINLSADKGRVLREAFRVLRPGGRLAVSDIVVRGATPPEVRRNMELWIGCVAGALEELEYRDLLADAGFRRVEIEPTRVYTSDDAAAFLAGSGLDTASLAAAIDGKFMSAFIRATKTPGTAPARAVPVREAACCGPTCCTEETTMIDGITTHAPPVTIRPATAADFTAIEALLTESHLPTVGIRESVCSLLVAEVDAQIVGVVGMESCGDYGLLRSTAVAPAWRGHRVARQLVERIIGEAESRGVRALYLLTTTAETYFPSFGFRPAAREAAPDEIRATGEFAGACPASATLMCLTLPA